MLPVFHPLVYALCCYFTAVDAAFYTTARINAARFSAVGVGDILSIFTAVVAAFYATARVNVSDIYASTVSLHVLDLIGSDYTAFGLVCAAYLLSLIHI